MCIIAAGAGMTAGAAMAANATLAISAVTTAASIGMGMFSAQQQAQQAQASMNMQAQQAVNAQVAQQQIASAQLQNANQLAAMQQSQQMGQMMASQNQANQTMAFQAAQNQQSINLSRQQAAQANNLAVAQANNSLLNTYNQQIASTKNSRLAAMERHSVELLKYQRGKEDADAQVVMNNEEANRAYSLEQSKVVEARKKAGFEKQTLLAKSIGLQGSILASGRTGQSVGLLLNDVDRQTGFAKAQEDATYASSLEMAGIGMESAFIRSQSNNQQAFNNIPFEPGSPYLPAFPDVPVFIDPEDLGVI